MIKFYTIEESQEAEAKNKRITELELVNNFLESKCKELTANYNNLIKSRRVIKKDNLKKIENLLDENNELKQVNEILRNKSQQDQQELSNDNSMWKIKFEMLVKLIEFIKIMEK